MPISCGGINTVLLEEFSLCTLWSFYVKLWHCLIVRLFNDCIFLVTDWKRMSWDWIIRPDFSLNNPLNGNKLPWIIVAIPVYTARKRMWVLYTVYALRLWFERGRCLFKFVLDCEFICFRWLMSNGKHSDNNKIKLTQEVFYEFCRYSGCLRFYSKKNQPLLKITTKAFILQLQNIFVHLSS